MREAFTPTLKNLKLVAGAISAGVMVALVGAGAWVWFATLNARLHPEWPWAAFATLLVLAALFPWLNGASWPTSTRDFRKFSFRLWRPEPGAWSGENKSALLAMTAGIVALYVFWIIVTPRSAPPDLSAYPTTTYRISVLVMGALVSGVVEEAAFRGYMQSQLERFGPSFAIGVTSVVFWLSHITHGLPALLALAPGYLMISVLYGLMAYRTGSILPGMALHVLGDFSYAFFALLRGDARLLIAPS